MQSKNNKLSIFSALKHEFGLKKSKKLISRSVKGLTLKFNLYVLHFEEDSIVGNYVQTYIKRLRKF